LVRADYEPVSTFFWNKPGAGIVLEWQNKYLIVSSSDQGCYADEIFRSVADLL